MTAYPILFAILLAGCLGADADSSVPVTHRDPQVAVASSSSAPQSDPNLRACLSDSAPNEEVELHIVGKETAGSSEILLIVWTKDARDAAFGSSAMLIEEDGTCRRLQGGSVSEAEWAAARTLLADPDVRDRQLAVQMEATGGIEGLRSAIETYRGEDWIRPRECEFGESDAEGLCLGPYEAEAYRRAGIDVPEPSRFDRAPGRVADLSRVPETLRSCVSFDARRENGEVEYIGALPNGPGQSLLFEVYRPNYITYEGEIHFHAAYRRPDGVCEKLADWRSNEAEYLASDIQKLLNNDSMRRRRTRVQVERAGSPTRFVELYRNQVQVGGPYACSEAAVGSNTICVSGPELNELRRLGVPVAPWPDSR